MNWNVIIPELLDKQRLIAITKSDMLDDELKLEMKEQLDTDFKGRNYVLFLL